MHRRHLGAGGAGGGRALPLQLQIPLPPGGPAGGGHRAPVDTLAVITYDVPLSDSVDFMKVYSRKIEIKGADTVMTFDGNNEIEFEANVPIFKEWRGWPLDIFLRVCSETNSSDCIHFANDSLRAGAIYGGIRIGSFVVDDWEQSIDPRFSRTGDAEKQKTPFVQRIRNNIVIHNGDKRYRLNGAGIQ